MANKVKRDPNAPRRNLSAYLLYQNAMRDQFRALNPGMTFGQLSKYTSAMYAEMPPAEKEAWVGRAEADKQRYLQELADYVPAPGYDEKGDAIMPTPLHGMVGHMQGHGGGRSGSGSSKGSRGGSSGGGKAERDVNAPKRNMSAYLLYQNAMRDQFKRENPGMTFGQLAKYTSHMYKNLTPEEKAIWVERAEQDKIRYDNEMAVYTPPPGHDARGNLIEESRPRKRNKRTPKDPDAPKRASGAYVFFTNEMRPEVMKQFPGIKFVEMGRILGERWRALQPDDKTRFEALAQEDKKRFQLEMQEYTATQAAQQAQQQAFAQAQVQAAAAAAAGAVGVGVHVQPTAPHNVNMNMVGMGVQPTPVGSVPMAGGHGQPQTYSYGQQGHIPQQQYQHQPQQQQIHQYHTVPTPNITSSSSAYAEPHQQQYQQQPQQHQNFYAPEQQFDPAKFNQLPQHQYH